MGQKIKKELRQFNVLLNSIPTFTSVMFVLSVFSMNLLANKSINLPFSWLALDCGIIVSWFSFLAMDMITKHFGPKAANEMSVFAIAVNLMMCLVFFIGSRISGVWGAAYAPEGGNIINAALDSTFGGTWYVLLGSTLAFLASSFVNNGFNFIIGKMIKTDGDGFGVYAARSYISTAAGQFTDNIIFALTVSHVFFGWSYLQCFTCALTGMAAELICEIVFSGFGYRTCRRWKQSGVGKEYFDLAGEKV